MESIWNTSTIEEIITLNKEQDFEFPCNDGIHVHVPYDNLNNLVDIQNLLGKISMREFYLMENDWKEFTSKPLKYEGSIVLDMVSQWLQEIR